MPLEERIVAWSKERPPWQRHVMRRVAAGDTLSPEDYDALVEIVVEARDLPASRLELSQLPQTDAQDLPVCVIAISKPEHVNALESNTPLTFEPQGLTIVYGDNGSGKSGYARLLKRIARARQKEDVLTDVFRDNALARPTALLSIRVGASEQTVSWPEPSRTELQRLLFYDAACGSAYITSESDFPYRPSALFVLDGLIEACVAVRTRIDAKLGANAASVKPLPNVPDEARESPAGRFLSCLSASSSIASLNQLIERFEATKETIDDLKLQEARLRSADTTKARQELTRQSEKLLALSRHIESLDSALGSEALAELEEHRATVNDLEKAAALLARSFQSEPLPSVGAGAWKELWAAAQRFSKELAYPDHDFPYLGSDCRCVLCQQPLGAPSRDRLVRFDQFVRNDTQIRLQNARRTFDQTIKNLRELVVSPLVIQNILGDLRDSHFDAVSAMRELLMNYEAARGQANEALATHSEIPRIEIEPAPIICQLTTASDAAKAAADDLRNAEGIQKQIMAIAARRAELELLAQIQKARPHIVNEIARLKARAALEAAKSAAATTGITKKILDLSEESITEVVRDTFTREADRLRLERVTIARTRADKGALLHQPKLVGARQQATLPKVFSEGERTALGLAAFLTEAHLDGSRSALILDDPVTSLDHIRRGLVAARLAELAENRQVILFTHDVAFVADLKREAAAKGVTVAERSVMKRRADERKPGACSTKHPWKAKDAQARLEELRHNLSRIQKESCAWDQNQYEDAVAVWAGNLSETWERIFSQEVVGSILAEGGLEVRPMMVRVLARFSEDDYREFEGSYSRASQWAKRHDKSATVNYVAPDTDTLAQELRLVDAWFKRIRSYKAG